MGVRLCGGWGGLSERERRTAVYLGMPVLAVGRSGRGQKAGSRRQMGWPVLAGFGAGFLMGETRQGVPPPSRTLVLFRPHDVRPGAWRR